MTVKIYFVVILLLSNGPDCYGLSVRFFILEIKQYGVDSSKLKLIKMLINLQCNAFHYNAELLFSNICIYINIYIFYCVYIFSKAVTFQNENGKHTKE